MSIIDCYWQIQKEAIDERIKIIIFFLRRAKWRDVTAAEDRKKGKN